MSSHAIAAEMDSTIEMAPDAKARILEAASDLFLQGGLRALSVRAIAKRAGVSTIGIYSHFQGKQGILDTLYIEGFTRVSAALAMPSEGVEPIDAIIASIERYLDNADRFGAHYKLIFGESDPDYEPSPEAKKIGIQAFQQLVALTALALPDETPLVEQQRFAMNIWALAHGFVSLRGNAVSQLIAIKDWRPMIIQAVRLHVAAYAQNF